MAKPAFLKTIGTPFREWFRSILIARARGHLRKVGNITTSRAAIIPPARPGNMGDAAMLSAAGDHLRTLGFKEVDLLHENNWVLDTPVDRYVPTSRFFFGNSVIQQAKVLHALERYSHIFFVGADVIDGAYTPGSVLRRIDLLGEACKAGKQAVILGASYNEHPNEDIRQALEFAPKNLHICARDPLSKQRLEKATRRSIRQTADVAFLLEPSREHPDARRALEWIASRRRVGDRIVAINMNYLLLAKQPGLCESYNFIIRALKAQRCSFLMVPHDTRSDQSDVAHLEKLVADNREVLRESAYLLRTDSPKATKAALAEADVLISGRMHAMILAMGAGTPSIGIVYQNKFEGMLQLFGFSPDKFTITPDNFIANPKKLEILAVHILDNLSQIKRDLEANLPAVRALSTGNFHVE